MRARAALAALALVAGCGGGSRPFGGGALPGTGGAAGMVAAGGAGAAIAGQGGGAGGQETGTAGAPASMGGSAGGDVTANAGAAGNSSTGGAAGQSTGVGAAGGTGGAQQKKTCLLDSDCGDPWTTSCASHAGSLPSTCEVTCDPPCGPGSACAGGNTCKTPAGTFVLSDERMCEASCDTATSVCLTNGTKFWTCTKLCTFINTINNATGCPSGSHCINYNSGGALFTGTGECQRDDGSAQPCGANGFCLDGTCNAVTRLCPDTEGGPCSTGADCISGACGPSPSGGMRCS